MYAGVRRTLYIVGALKQNNIYVLIVFDMLFSRETLKNVPDACTIM